MCCKKDYWNVDVDRSLSDSWTGFTKFTFFKKKKLLQDIFGSGSAVRRSKKLPDLIICGLKCGLACQKQLRSRNRKNGPCEKPKVDNARRLLRHLFHRSRRWRDRKETIKNASEISWKIPMDAAMPGKIRIKEALEEAFGEL